MENTQRTQYYSTQITRASHQITVFKVQPEEPFSWAHGWKSPIHGDIKIFLGYPKYRALIKKGLLDLIETHHVRPDLIAGVATGGNSHAARIADALDLPETYTYPEIKKHGRENQIAGISVANKKVLIIDDAFSTGSSTAKSIDTIRKAGGIVTHCFSIFQYGFPVMKEIFSGKKPYAGSGEKLLEPCIADSLFDYRSWVDLGMKEYYLDKETITVLNTWFLDPEGWSECYCQKDRA